MFSAKKLDKLVTAKIISETQKQQILNFEKNNNSGTISNLLTTLGIFTLAIGAISLVSANWENISKTIKLMIMLATLSATGALAVHYQNKGAEEKAEKTLLFLFLLCGTAIGLVIQVFHLQGGRMHTPLGFWCLLGVPLLAASKKKYVAGFWVPLFAVWVLFFYPQPKEWEDYPLWCLYTFGVFSVLGFAIEKFIPSRNKLGEVLKKDSLFFFYLSLAGYIITGYNKPLRFVISAIILSGLSLLFHRFRIRSLIRRNIKFFGLLIVMLYINLGDKIGLLSTGFGLIISGTILIVLVKYWPKIIALVEEKTKNA